MDELDRYLAGTVHMDKAFKTARKTYALSATSQSFDEHLHVATLAMAANAVRTHLDSDEVVERAGAALHPLVNEEMCETMRDAWCKDLARAALQAAGGKQDGR